MRFESVWLQRIEDEESEDEGGEGDEEEDREIIANELFEGSDHVSNIYELTFVVTFI